MSMMTTIQRLNGLEKATADLSTTLVRLEQHMKERPPRDQRHLTLAWEVRLRGIEEKRDKLIASIEELAKR